MDRRCVAVLGGSFDPVHLGHVALAAHFLRLLQPDELRIIPAGNPWQKAPLAASGEQRIAMLERAFGDLPATLVIDRQEIDRHTASYSVDTLRALRAELGPETAIAFLMGADQLQNLHTWRDWQQLFGLAHLCAASRPGYGLDQAGMQPDVAVEFAARAMAPATVRDSAAGGALLAPGLDVDISATAIRSALAQHGDAAKLLPAPVLDYIQQHHLYQS